MRGFDFILFENVDFQGERLFAHRASDYCMPFPQVPCGFDCDPNLHRIGAGDRVSSVIVRAGFLALYEGSEFRGRALMIGPGEQVNNLIAEGFNDKASSWIACNAPFDTYHDMLVIRSAIRQAVR